MKYDEVKLREFVVDRTPSDSAHDIAHIERVVRNAKQYATMELANLDVVVPAAWLHDCVTVPKNSPDRAYASTMAADEAENFLLSINYDKALVELIRHAIESHSYSADIETNSLEAMLVQDADRIDALGAVGVSRCLLVGGSLNRALYSVEDPFCEDRESDDERFCIDHFFRKLFSIADTLKTEAGKVDAQKPVEFMNYTWLS